MTQPEFIRLMNTQMMYALRCRDCIDPMLNLEQYGYQHGQFKAYEHVISLLSTFDVDSVPADCQTISPVE